MTLLTGTTGIVVTAMLLLQANSSSSRARLSTADEMSALRTGAPRVQDPHIDTRSPFVVVPVANETSNVLVGSAGSSEPQALSGPPENSGGQAQPVEPRPFASVWSLVEPVDKRILVEPARYEAGPERISMVEGDESVTEVLSRVAVSPDVMRIVQSIEAAGWMRHRADRTASEPVVRLYRDRVGTHRLSDYEVRPDAPAQETPDADSWSGTGQSHATLLQIEKSSPREATGGVVFSYEVSVENTGQQAVRHAEAVETLPQGWELVDARPRGTYDESKGTLRWTLGSLESGERRVLRIDVLPDPGGTSVARTDVRTVAAVALRTKVAPVAPREPMPRSALPNRADSESVHAPGARQAGARTARAQLHISAPATVRAGQRIRLQFRVCNLGTTTVRDSTIRILVPDEMCHRLGKRLDHSVGALAPGERITAQLTLLAKSPGTAVSHAVLLAGSRRLDSSQRTTAITPPASSTSRSVSPCSVHRIRM